MHEGLNLLVVIDHRQARIFRAELRGTVPRRITPYDPHGSARHLHRFEPAADGRRKPELRAYFEALAMTLRGAERVLVLGSGPGVGDTMDLLIEELKRRRPDIAAHVAGAIVIDEQHTSEAQILARAREFYETVSP